MICLYLENKPELLSVSRENALPAQQSQVLEIFSKLDSKEAIILGLLINTQTEIKIYPFSRFVWRVEIIKPDTTKQRQLYYSTQKVIGLIKDLYQDLDDTDKSDLH